MSSFIHTLLATGFIALAFYLGRFMSHANFVDKFFSVMTGELIRHLEKDGFVKIEIDDDGDHTLVPISEIEETARCEYVKETLKQKLEEVKDNV